jgi:hypothetical protein
MKAKSTIATVGVTALFLVALHLSGHTTAVRAQQSPPVYGDPQAMIEKIFGPTRQVEVRDPFYNNVVAFTITVPKDWFFEGTVLHGPGCMGMAYQSIAYRAYSPDASIGVQVAPRLTYYYWEDRYARPVGADCKFFAPMYSSDYAAMFTYRMRPNAQIDKVEPVLDIQQIYATLEKNNEQAARSAYPLHMPAEYDTGDFTRTRIHYEWEGYQEEEWLRVEMIYKDMPKSAFVCDGGPHPGRAEWRHFLQTDTFLYSRRAPRGKLDEYEPALAGIINTVRLTPDFVQATNARQQQITNMIVHSIQNQVITDQQNSQAFMNAMTSQHNQFMAQQQQRFDQHQREVADQTNRQNTQVQNFIGQMNSSTARTRDYQDILLDQQYYHNPQTGETSTVSGRLAHTWANGPASSNATSYLQNRDPNCNPNGIFGYNWVELMPIHH